MKPVAHALVPALGVIPTLRSHQCERGTHECVRHNS